MADWNSEKRQQEIEANKLLRVARRRHKVWKRLTDPKVKEKSLREAQRARFFKVKILNEKQHKAIELLSDFMNCWSPLYICGQCEISLATLYKWRNDPFFLRELDKEITRRRTIFRLEAHRHLFRMIKRGKPRLLLAYLKMTGDFTQKVEITDKTNVDDMKESELDREIEQLSDELGISSADK